MRETFAKKVLNQTVSVVLTLVQLSISILLTLMFGPILILIWLINELLRFFVSLVLRLEYGSKIHLSSSGTDNIWQYKRFGNNKTCFALHVHEDPIDVQQFSNRFEREIINHETPDGKMPYEKLKKVFVTKYGYHCFKLHDDFNISNHTTVYPSSESRLVNEEELMTKILPELSIDMDPSRPQWENFFIPRFKLDTMPDKEVTLRIFRFHHEYMDGITHLLLLARFMSEYSVEEFPCPIKLLEPPNKGSPFAKFSFNIYCFLMAAWSMVKILAVGGKVRNRYTADKFSGRRHYGWSQPLAVDELRVLKTSLKISFPTVVAAATASTLRKMEAKFVSQNGYKTPENTMIGMVLAILPYPNYYPRNNFVTVHFPLPTGDMTGFQRAARIHKEMIKLSRDPAVPLTLFMMKFFGRMPGFVIQLMMGSGGFPITFSNIPVTDRQMKLWGNTVHDSGGFPAVLTNTGFGIVTWRYADIVRFCCVADDNCLSREELDFFLSEVTSEIRDMAEKCRNQISTQVVLTLEKSTKTFRN